MTPRLYKASEVCEATGLQPYVLRSWEKEFPGIGVQKSLDSPRLYRQSDLDQVLRIKQLVFVEGLTLAGARRRLDEEAPRAAESGDSEIGDVLDTLGADARSRIELVRTGLRSILDVLSQRAGLATLPDLAQNGSRRDAPWRTSTSAQSGRGGRSSTDGRRSSPSARLEAAKRPAAAKRGMTPARKAKTGKRKRASA
ncbi:MAG: MerR family transcriptional regulator [Vicinamibacterales bacterium]